MRIAQPATLALLACLATPSFAQDASTPAAPPTTAPGAPSNAPPATPPGSADNSSAKPPPANLETLAAADARSILGKKVSGAAGEDMGLVVDVLFDANKKPRAAIIDFGGFLGVGTRKIAIDWKMLQFYAPDAKTPLKLDLSRADVQSAPEYKPGDKTISVIAGPGIVAPAAAPSPASENTPTQAESASAPPDNNAPPASPAPPPDTQ